MTQEKSTTLSEQRNYTHGIELGVQSTLSKTDTFGTGTKCPSYRESSKRSKQRQGPTLSVRFTEVFVL